MNVVIISFEILISTHFRRKLNIPKTSPGFMRLNADIPEVLFKEFAKRCIEEGVSKKDFLVQLLEKELFKDSKK